MPPALITGLSCAGVMVRLLVLSTLVAAPAASELASVTLQWIVRVVAVVLTVGSSLLELKVIERSAVWYCALVAVPLRLSVPAPS